jgi:23S rRNA maturation-related 3'-5' exoribonuclease YhaM
VTLEELVGLIDDPNRERCSDLWLENYARFARAPGSSHNHQAWPGGYAGHVTETMQIACAIYPAMSAHHPLPFSLSDALLVMFLHDLEKPWRVTDDERKMLTSKQARRDFRGEKIRENFIEITAEQENALRYVEGENDDYSPGLRVMNELAAFCHCCDIASARIWHDWPKRSA